MVQRLRKFENIDKLCDIGSAPILANFERNQADQALAELGSRQSELIHMLQIKNGFYAFESALHVFPFSPSNLFEGQDLIHWNASSLWKYAYGSYLDETFCFAEDIFGYQFCIADSRIRLMDPETGQFDDICGTVEEWAGLVCDDFNVRTGFPVAHEWQRKNGPLKFGNRLVPIYPLVSSQGTYNVENFYEINALRGLLSRADFAKQIASVPDGGRIRLTAKNL